MNRHEKLMMRDEITKSKQRVDHALSRLGRLEDEQIDRIEDKINIQVSMSQRDSANIDEIKRLLVAMNEPKREPVIDVTGIVEMKRDEWAGEFYDVRIDLNDDLTDLLEPYNGKRVRVTVEVIEEETE